MAIVLFTDFGTADLYVGQVKGVLAALAPGEPLVDLLNDACDYDIESAAHLLAALAPQFPAGSVFLAVVDPGVGTLRDAIVVEADGRRYVGPDNGLLSVVFQRATTRRCSSIIWKPSQLSSSFHGRDLFAPVAARLAAGILLPEWLVPKAQPEVMLDPAPLARVVYVDHFGNCITGVYARGVDRAAHVVVEGRALSFARVFGAAPPGEPFWYENSCGLIELALVRGSAAQALGVGVGAAVALS